MWGCLIMSDDNILDLMEEADGLLVGEGFDEDDLLMVTVGYNYAYMSRESCEELVRCLNRVLQSRNQNVTYH